MLSAKQLRRIDARDPSPSADLFPDSADAELLDEAGG